MYTLEKLRDWWQNWRLHHFYSNFYLKKLVYGNRFHARQSAKELLRRYHHQKLRKPNFRQIGAIIETVPDFRKDAALVLLQDCPIKLHLRCIIDLVPESREQAARELLHLGDCSLEDWELISKKVPSVALISRLRRIYKPLD